VSLPPSINEIDALSIAPTRLPDEIHNLFWFSVSDKNLPVKRARTESTWSREWYMRVKEGERLEETERRKRTIQRTKEIKERLMAATWHTDRVLAWCDPHAFDYDD